MGKKRSAAVGAAAAPVFPFPADAAGEPDHFSDYGFDPQLVGFFPQREAKRPSLSSRRHQPPPPLDSARFKLQKPISKKHHHHHLQKQQQQRRRRWWSSAASAALLLFKRTSSSGSAAAPAPCPYGSFYSAAVPLYLADDDAGADDGPAACACWAPAMRSGRLAAAEIGAAADAVPYVSLRSASLGGAGGGAGGAGGGAPTMPIYLVT